MKKVISESVYLLCACCLAVLLPFGLTACSSDDKPFVDNEPIAAVNGGDVVKGINVSLSDFVSDVAGTRTTYADKDGGVKVTWADADTIGIFPNQGGQVEFPIEAGTESNQATFDGGGWALKSNSTYSAYYPYRATASVAAHNIPYHAIRCGICWYQCLDYRSASCVWAAYSLPA